MAHRTRARQRPAGDRGRGQRLGEFDAPRRLSGGRWWFCGDCSLGGAADRKPPSLDSTVRPAHVDLIDMTTDDDPLSTITRRIEEARQMVTAQKVRIARLKAAGVDATLADLTLKALEANLKRFANHSDWWSERKEQKLLEPLQVSS
jgi:hypothetical protein